ncbi:D-Ala-D-Ala carboxypeptidase family metallohydrolase [Xylanibacter ruminicola]|uniref:D-Ala-D-Ala carboxypeptidase family metallohydrolase n=1 Tax=Xylanibacter ruminicola TaxID=839 RepID=UPI0020C8EC1A|nr:D-Ala-D-Ala carboxypeptidase family metallohydrolase [Xylanibacter ruminicola]
MNSGAKLSPHFTLGELPKSSSHPEIYNVPTHEAIANLKNVCTWLEALRSRYHAPIIINSGYRSPQLNRVIGGAATSNHLTGCAVDIRVIGMEQLIRYAAILLEFADETYQDFDELLVKRNRFGAIWLHFAVRFRGNRHKVLYINA